MNKNVILVLNLVISCGLGVYVFMHKPKENKAYILNQKIFEAFKGKKELETRLLTLKKKNKQTLDSLAVLVQSRNNDAALIKYYQETAQNFELTEQELSTKYTSDIWKRINQYIADFGKEKNYDFIYGATGDGNLMYANEMYDVTDDVILYINKNYEAE